MFRIGSKCSFNMSKLILILLSFLVVSEVTCDEFASRIVGGDVTQLPYAVSLQSNPKVHVCAGSIIDTRWILTSANCIALNTLKYVQPGTSNLNNLDYIFHISTTKSHPSYDKTTGINNIGMVKTLQPFVYSSTVRNIYLGVSTLPGGYQMTAFGWGTNALTPITPFTDLRTTIYTSMTNLACSNDFVPPKFIDDRQLCGLRARDKGVCVGDSGGGVVYGDRIHGVIGIVPIAANATVECADGRPVVFARVYNYYNWIYETLKT
ncbi:chymotrypsin-1-like [Arctopsyche grandis]|uniref:chymotrypsin-1-like n=1 Tax=Arctopsyche grandis TaxID=121162 RepID=UPI00406D8D26